MIYAALLGLIATAITYISRHEPLRLEAGLLIIAALFVSTAVHFALPGNALLLLGVIDGLICLYFCFVFAEAARRQTWIVVAASMHGAMLLAHVGQSLYPIDPWWYMSIVNLLVYGAIFAVGSGPVWAAWHYVRKPFAHPVDRFRAGDLRASDMEEKP